MHKRRHCNIVLQQRSQLPNARKAEASMHLHCLYGVQVSFALHAILVARVNACNGQGTPTWPVHSPPIMPQGVSHHALRHREVHLAIVSARTSCPYGCTGGASAPVRANSQCALRRDALIRAPGGPGERRAHLYSTRDSACLWDTGDLACGCVAKPLICQHGWEARMLVQPGPHRAGAWS